MNRRTFLTRVCGGAVAAAIVAHVPLSWVPEPVRRQGAIDYLVKQWRDYTRGRSIRQFPTRFPSLMTAGSDLFDAFDAEIIATMRRLDNAILGPFTNTQYPGSLMFKAATLRRGGPGWWVTFDA